MLGEQLPEVFLGPLKLHSRSAKLDGRAHPRTPSGVPRVWNSVKAPTARPVSLQTSGKVVFLAIDAEEALRTGFPPAQQVVDSAEFLVSLFDGGVERAVTGEQDPVLVPHRRAETEACFVMKTLFGRDDLQGADIRSCFPVSIREFGLQSSGCVDGGWVKVFEFRDPGKGDAKLSAQVFVLTELLVERFTVGHLGFLEPVTLGRQQGTRLIALAERPPERIARGTRSGPAATGPPTIETRVSNPTLTLALFALAKSSATTTARTASRTTSSTRANKLREIRPKSRQARDQIPSVSEPGTDEPKNRFKPMAAAVYARR